ncbi:hypothetical protein [Janibacter sp. GS2]|uniref:peptidoglycan-binding domain-containing protein n=1 Tax=Janibacter sp. GS2 TaxID=3442646 RepID=UPI003EB927FE
MARMWMPGAVTLPSSRDGGSMVGGPARATEHVMVTPYTWSALQAARYLIAQGSEAHLTLHPISGHVVQMVPAHRAARALVNRGGGWESNRAGRYNVQTEVVAMPNGYTKDVTAAGKRALAARANWLDSLGVTRSWVGGSPPRTYAEANNGRTRNDWNWRNKSGWFGHGQVPEGNTHWDPGPIDVGTAMAKGAGGGIILTPGSVGAEWYAPDDLSTSTIKALQRAVGVKADGVMGPKTAKATQQWLKVRVDGDWGPNTIKALQRKVGSTPDGIWGPATAAALRRYLDRDADGGDDLAVDGLMGANTVRAIEKWTGSPVKGTWTPWDIKALQRKINEVAPNRDPLRIDGRLGRWTVKRLQRIVGTPDDGDWGPNTTQAFQRYLNRVL